MVTFQKQDHAFILNWQATLEDEIRHIIADREEHNVFTNPVGGIWYGLVGFIKTNLESSLSTP